MAGPMISLDQLPPEILQLIEAHKAGTGGTRSPVRHQLKDLREPHAPLQKLHRPNFSWSADADPDQPPYRHQDFPKLMFHPSQGEIAVMNPEAMEALGSDWSETPISNAAVKPFDAVRAELDSLSPEDRQLVLDMQRQAKMNRLNTLMSGLTDSEVQSLVSAPSDVGKRSPGRPKKAPNGDGA